MKREDYMQDALYRSLRYTHPKAYQALKPSLRKAKETETVDRNFGPRAPHARGVAAATPKGGSHGRSQSTEGTGKQLNKHILLCNPERNM